MESLRAAVSAGEVNKVRTLLQGKDNTRYFHDLTPLHSTRYFHGLTPLHIACKSGHLNVVRVLVSEFNAEVNIGDYHDKTPLHYACEEGNTDVTIALVSEFNADLSMRSNSGRTPLMLATRKGHNDVVLALLRDHQCPVTDMDWDGWGVLHHACAGGSVAIVQTLIDDHKADVGALNGDRETPLVVAFNYRKINVVSLLICNFGCDPNVKNLQGYTPLHYACESGDVGLVLALIHEHKADINTYSWLAGTPLHAAFRAEQFDVLLSLMSHPSCDPCAKDQDGQTVLHLACKAGNIDLVNTLLLTHKMDINTLTEHKETPLQIAAASNLHQVALALIKKHGCDTNLADSQGKTPLHCACERGNIDLVQTLINEYEANVNAYSKLVGAPLHAAFRAGKYEVLLSLMRHPSCDPYAKDQDGQTILHLACITGNIDEVNSLLHTHKMEVNACNGHNETPLHVALASNQYQVALALMKEHGCDITALDRTGWTGLHVACKQGAIDVVHALIGEMTDINVRTDQNVTPLHMAALGGHYDVVLALVSDARCDTSARDNLKRTALHAAAYRSHHKIVQELLKYTSPLAVDDRGNTPLHIASKNWCVSTLQCLLHDNAPVLVRNANGSTPRDLARGECGRILEEYIKVNRKLLQDHYSTILRLSEKKYSGSQRITRLFVLGNPGVGKSSLIESLKREGFFESFGKVSESSVPPHTAGIIPSVYMSSQYGRVLFYDFAGDAEYYSSHAAIFEGLASSKRGDNIFIIAVDLREDSVTTKTTLHYWYSFIQYQKFDRPSFIVVGSHLDQYVQQSDYLDEFCTAMQPYVHSIKHFMLDCRDPRSSQIAQVKKHIFTLIGESQKYKLSKEARLLLGLLEKDFCAVTACPVQTLVSHIKDCGGWLPVEPKPLYQILLELHEVGVLLLLGDCTKDSDHIVLNISELTNTVHQILFAKSAFSTIQETHPNLGVNIGILPDSVLEDVLPQYITKECLIHLQYCQEIFHTSVSLFPSPTSQSFLFFPALCSVDKGQVPWDKSTSHHFNIRWLALCTDLHDYFPPRFLHVLLLRLVQRFTLSVPAEMVTAHASFEHSRRCTMWKKGVFWKMEEGVDVMVELMKGNKGVVVLSKSSLDGSDDCARIFTKVASCVMEAKAEFCHSTKPRFFFLDSSTEADYLNEDHQFAMSDVEKALKNPEGKRVVISVLGRREMDLSNFQWMHTLTHWNAFFPITGREVLRTLEEVVDRIFELGLSLGASWAFLESLKANFPSDVNQRKIGLVSWWMKSTSPPPCWYTLVEALKDIEIGVMADKLREKHCLHIQLQEKMLSETQGLKPDKKFLHSLSDVVGSRWPSLAVSLALTEGEIEELKGKVGLPQKVLALQMLKIWASKEEASYGQLCRQVMTISLF